MINARVVGLWLMMLFQYAIWGGWVVVAGKYMSDPKPMGLDFDGGQQGWIFMLLPLATILIPMLTGQFADRFINSEKLMGILHLLSGACLWKLASTTDFQQFLFWMLLHSVFYAPTLALSNSITFANLSDGERQFGIVRVAGTIGWILAGLALTFWRTNAAAPVVGDLFLLSAGFSLVLGVICFFLPKTPPDKQGDPLAFRQAFSLFKNRDFLIFMLISFVVGTELEFYYIHTSTFLGTPKSLGGQAVSGASMGAVMSIGQWAEIVVMLMLPFFIKKFGIRKLLVIGAIAWPIRYAIFAFLPTSPLVVPSLALHGFCYVFFFVVGFIYVDKVAPHAIRASAQALYALVVLGLGRAIGSLVAGYVQGHYTERLPGILTVEGIEISSKVDWTKVFMVPTVLTVACAVFFPLLFRGSNDKDASLPTGATH